MVIGNAGGGKSTLGRAVQATYDLPLLEVDRIQWQPGWHPAPENEVRATLADWQARERWIIDGYGPWEQVEARMAVCDTIIFVDHPFHIHLWWATKRQIKSLFAPRPDGPPDCPMWRMTFRLYAMMWRLHRNTRPMLIQLIQSRPTVARLIHITSPTQLNAFLANPV